MPMLNDIIGRPASANPMITGITADSRAVVPGCLFAALPGVKVDGARFIADAVAKGAVAVICAPGTVVEGAVAVHDDNPRRAFALAAARFHGAQPAHMVAVTGTNGKTSTASFFRQICGQLGLPAASIGTLGVHAPGYDIDKGLTTPDPAALHATLAELARRGVTHACMEASSHGLDQHRLDGVALKAAAFTNLTRDHLDYHASLEAYRGAKLRLFADLLPAGGIAVVNADSPEFEAFAAAARAKGAQVWGYGAKGAELRLRCATATPSGHACALEIHGQRFDIQLPLAGSFQAENALCALGLVLACGADAPRAVAALERLQGVPGRLQHVASRASGAPVYVDYAHTPDALETLRPHATGKLVVVFGCGGDRDPGKRPQMGKIAAELADRVYVTDDNPRTEAAAPIRAAILAACPGAVEIADRVQAIRAAVAGLEAGDVLVVAGKGHEQGQIVGDTVLPMDDAEEARKAVALLGEAA